MFKEFMKICGGSILAIIFGLIVVLLIDFAITLPMYAIICALSPLVYSLKTNIIIAIVLFLIQAIL